MVFRLSLPAPGKYKKNTEDLIISILAKEFPLTLRQLHNKIKKDFGVSITYQAIRKTVNNLVYEKILIKQNRSYLINRTWILETIKVIENLKKSYFELRKPQTEVHVGENVTEYSFNNLIEKDRVWCKIQEDWLDHIEKSEAKIISWQGSHNWWLLGQLEHETRFMKLIKSKVKVYQLVNGKTFLDKWSVRYYTKLGVNCTLNKEKKIDMSNQIVVFGDYVMQTFYPQELVKKLERFYLKIKKLEDADLNEIMDILTSSQNIKVTLIKNKEISKQIMQGIIKHFK